MTPQVSVLIVAVAGIIVFTILGWIITQSKLVHLERRADYLYQEIKEARSKSYENALKALPGIQPEIVLQRLIEAIKQIEKEEVDLHSRKKQIEALKTFVSKS